MFLILENFVRYNILVKSDSLNGFLDEKSTGSILRSHFLIKPFKKWSKGVWEGKYTTSTLNALRTFIRPFKIDANKKTGKPSFYFSFELSNLASNLCFSASSSAFVSSDVSLTYFGLDHFGSLPFFSLDLSFVPKFVFWNCFASVKF